MGISSLPEFGDFDDVFIHEQVKGAIVHESTPNFAIEFDSTKAYAAHNLNVDSIERLLDAEASSSVLIKFTRS